MGSILGYLIITKGVLFVQHEVHGYTERPHIYLKAVLLLQVELGAHVTSCTKHSLASVRLFAQSEVCNFISLF